MIAELPPRRCWDRFGNRSASIQGAPFTDVAIMAPVPGRGPRVPMPASGDAAGHIVEVLRPFGASIEVMAGPAGLAAERKLLRSAFFKGMAAAAADLLGELGVPADVASATRDHLARL